jgi:hypothetical protein
LTWTGAALAADRAVISGGAQDGDVLVTGLLQRRVHRGHLAAGEGVLAAAGADRHHRSVHGGACQDRLRSGVAALALSWAAGTGAYFLFINLDSVPPALRAATGLRNPGSPIAAPDFGSALIAVGLWQAVFFIALRGWPVNTITRRSPRLLAGNALVLGLTYIGLRNLANWQPDAIGAACGCVISAVLIVAMVFENWPAARHPAAPGRALTLALTAVVALKLNRTLAAYADGVHWTKATPDDWITIAALSFTGAGIILHVGIGLRWPFVPENRRELMKPCEPQPRRGQARCCHQRREPGCVPGDAHAGRIAGSELQVWVIGHVG